MIFRYLRLLSLLALLAAGWSRQVCADGHKELDIVILGDSNTWIGGDDCSKDIGWTKWFASKFNPSSIRSYARSGATWTNTSGTRRDTKSYSEVIDDRNTIYNQMARLIEAAANRSQPSPEIIMIGAGANDAWFDNKRPYVFHQSVDDAFRNESPIASDADVSKYVSLASSIRLVCETLMREFPAAQIVLLTSPQIKQCSYERQRQVNDVIEECGRRLSVNVIPLDAGCGTYRIFEKSDPVNTSDGAHNSITGARRTGNYVASQLQSILLF